MGSGDHQDLKEKKDGGFTHEPHLGSAGRRGGGGRHGGTAVVALAGTGTGSCRGGRSGGGFGSSASRSEGGHPLGGSLRQDELLSEFEVGPSSCWKGTKERRAEVCVGLMPMLGLRRSELTKGLLQQDKG